MKLSLLTFMSLFATTCFAIDAEIYGNEVVRGGSIQTYSVSFTHWDETYDEMSTVSWNVSRGTILSSNNQSVTIQWETWVGEDDGYGYIWVSESWGGQSGFFETLVNNYPQGSTQLCEGVLGPPKVFVDFGRGSSPGAALPSGTTTYAYSVACGLTPNQYTVVTNTNFCRGLWWQLPEDHTPGDVNGYMLMVDGNQNRSVVFRTNVTGLIPGTVYEFSAFAGNLYNVVGGTNPDLTFEIYNQAGVRLGQSGTIDIPATNPFSWQKIGFTFELPLGTTALEIILVDQQRATGGNDFVIDDISFAPCYPPIVASFLSNPERKNKEYVCSNGSVNLYAWWPLTIQFTNPIYQWQRSADNGVSWNNISGATSLTSSYTESSANIYLYRMYVYDATNPALSLYSNILTYYVQTVVVEAKTFDVYGCTGTAAGQLQPTAYLQFADPSVAQSYTYSWSPGTHLSSTTTNNPTFSVSVPVPPPGGSAPPPVNYPYTLTVTNTTYGCTASNTQTVAVRSPRKVMVPNGFTPNGDGHNDLWRPVNIQDYPGAKLWIFHRWGELVFYRENGSSLADYSWNGIINGILTPSTTSFVWQVFLPGCPSNISAYEGEGVAAGNVILIR
jgi:gliding motility-associated-like protein